MNAPETREHLIIWRPNPDAAIATALTGNGVHSVPTLPGSRPRTGLPPLKPYRYQGTEADALTPWLDDPAAGLPRPPSANPPHGLAMCGPCWDDMCEMCAGELCACACETGRQP